MEDSYSFELDTVGRMEQEDSKAAPAKEVEITQVIGEVAGCISTLTAKGFNEDSKTAIVDHLLGVISNVTKYSRHMELQIELGVSREHEAIRLLEKFKKIAKQQKTMIDTMSEHEKKRSSITTSAVDTNTSLTGNDMVAQEDELRKEIATLCDRLARRTEECRKLGGALKKSEKSEKKLRRIVQRSQEIMHAQEALMQGPDRTDHQMDYSSSFERYKDYPADENQLYLSSDSVEETAGDVEYEYGSNGGARGGFPPPAKGELAMPVPSPHEVLSRVNGGGVENYGVFSEAKARTRVNERKIFEITEAQVGAEFHQDSSSSQRYANNPEVPNGIEANSDNNYFDEEVSEVPEVPLSPLIRSPPRIVASTSPKSSPRRSPVRSSAGSKSPKNPKEAIFNFVEEVALQEESDVDLSFLAAKDERNSESPEKRVGESPKSVGEERLSDDHSNSISTLRDSPERSPKSRRAVSPFEEVDSLEDSFSMIQKYY